ncbi:MAG TPA: hypothetical protein VF222_07940, partial [Nitrososphaeraceae archaeon]
MVFVITVETLPAFITMKVILQQGSVDLDRKKIIIFFNNDFIYGYFWNFNILLKNLLKQYTSMSIEANNYLYTYMYCKNI